MALVAIGALLLIGGVVLLAVRPLRHGQLSGGRLGTGVGETLEPRRPARGFGIRANWPGLALCGLGAILLLTAASFGL